MSWFSDIFTSIKDFVAPVTEAVSQAAPVISAVAPIASAVISSNSNAAARDQYNQSQEAARAAQAAANAQAAARWAPALEAGDQARTQLRSISALDPNVMTASQRIQLDDAQRNTNARLASSGLRGAGRAQAAVVNDLNHRMGATFADQNQRRADAATNTLSGQGQVATGQVSTIDQNTGRADAASIREIGANDASYELAQGRNAGTAIGAIASQIASDAKDRARERRFSKMTAQV